MRDTWRRPAVIPPSAVVEDGAPSSRDRNEREDGPTRAGARWLAVGRVSPNKALEDTVAALAVTRAHADPAATLLVVGKPAAGAYEGALRRYVAELGLAGAVTFTGHARDDTVADAYRAADVLVVTSAHEGFCVPAVEALAAGLPVVAFDQGALPEVLGDAGTLVTSRNPYDLAAAIGTLLGDATRRAALAAAAPGRLTQLDLPAASDRFAEQLCALLDGGGKQR
jgi:glycosyltransferase involved in cell wall biosynthesis